jgi:CBS domain-containing protein
MRAVTSEMTSVPIVDVSTTIQDASAAMLDAHVEAAIVVEGTKLRGLLTAGDVAHGLALGRDVGSTPVTAVASSDPTLVKTREPLVEAHMRMRDAGEPLAVVVDDDGRAVGILADDRGRTEASRFGVS